ncbi:MAG: L-lysine 6-transaminase [Bdellovibrionales bacterium]|nr:L-lysine 6-transaminase [Bdellovibrionales bacterium]
MSISPEQVFESLERYLLPDVIPVVMDLERSQGNRIFCAREKKWYLDCFSYIASNPLGHNHPLLSEPAFERKLLRVAKTKPSNSDFYCVELADFVDTFARLATPAAFPHLFFIEGGALAVENALKVAFDWKIRRNKRNGVSGEVGTRVLHFKQAFHGRSGYTLSLTNTADPRKTMYFPKFDWPRVLNPKIRFPRTAENDLLTAQAEADAEAEIRAAFDRYGADIAAIIIEPIQGEGGDNHFRPEFHATLRRLADEFEALLIYDEVQSGMGLTGRMWAYEHYGITPDIVSFGKKAQVCGVMAGRRVDEEPQNVFVERSRINSTWGGNLTDMVRCQRFLEIIEQERLVENARDVGDYLLQGLERLVERHDGLLSAARGKGLMLAIDAPDGPTRDAIFAECFKRGALILKCGMTSLRLRPSLTFSKSEADELLAILDQSVQRS